MRLPSLLARGSAKHRLSRRPPLALPYAGSASNNGHCRSGSGGRNRDTRRAHVESAYYVRAAGALPLPSIGAPCPAHHQNGLLKKLSSPKSFVPAGGSRRTIHRFREAQSTSPSRALDRCSRCRPSLRRDPQAGPDRSRRLDIMRAIDRLTMYEERKRSKDAVDRRVHCRMCRRRSCRGNTPSGSCVGP